MVLNTGHIVGVLTEEAHCEMGLLFACLNHMPLGSFLETLLVQRCPRNESRGGIRGTLGVWSLSELGSRRGVGSGVPSGHSGSGTGASVSPSVRRHGQGCPLGGL